MGYGFSYFAQYEEQAIGAQWSNIGTSPIPDDTFSLEACISMMFLDTIIYFILTWYIEAVFPGGFWFLLLHLILFLLFKPLPCVPPSSSTLLLFPLLCPGYLKILNPRYRLLIFFYLSDMGWLILIEYSDKKALYLSQSKEWNQKNWRISFSTGCFSKLL